MSEYVCVCVCVCVKENKKRKEITLKKNTKKNKCTP
jgi:hypothetical protein